MFNKNELILDKVRQIAMHDLTTSKLIGRLTSVEEPSLECTAEGDEVTDAVGALITTLYRAKKATLKGSGSLLSLDLLAMQYGTEKQIAKDGSEIVDYMYEVLEIQNGKVLLKETPCNEIKYIYSVESGEIGTAYTANTQASQTEFVVDASKKTITVPTGLTGKIYVEYNYKNSNAVTIKNSASNFPSACSLVVYAYFKDKCNENLTYSGKVICPKAKLNPEQMEIALTSTGKHPFEFNMMKDYCAEQGDDELFTIIVSQ